MASPSLKEQVKAEIKQVGDDKLGQILVRLGKASRAQVDKALVEQKRLNETSQKKFKLGEILLFLGLVNLNDLHDALRHQIRKARSARTSREPNKAGQ